MTVSFPSNNVLFAVSTGLSFLSMVMIVSSYLANKRLRQHPSLIFVIMSVAQFISCFHFLLWSTRWLESLSKFDISQLQ